MRGSPPPSPGFPGSPQAAGAAVSQCPARARQRQVQRTSISIRTGER